MQHRSLLRASVILGLILIPGLSPASSSSLVQQGNAAYEAGNFDEALKAYEQAGVDDPESPQIYFNEGAAYYRKAEFKKAKEAWQKAALNSKDLSLEAKALFNLGDLAFSETKRQHDSDLQKSLDACTQSIKYYQQALDLSKNPTDAQTTDLKKDASENIEMVRLVMKSILDAMRKQQEQRKHVQQAADSIKQLVARQRELNKRDQDYNEERQKNGDPSQTNGNISRMARDQQQLKAETRDTAQKLPDQPKSDAVQKAKENLQQAQEHQQKAADNMQADNLTAADREQEAALEKLKNALTFLENKNAQAAQQHQQQSPENQNAKASQGEQQRQEKSSQDRRETAASNVQTKQKQDAAIARLPDDAESILNEEKENQKGRQPLASGGYSDVDKDW